MGDSALHLAFDQQRIDRPADIVRRHEPRGGGGAERGVDFDRRELGGIAVLRIGRALPVLVQRRGRRIVGFLGPQNVPFRTRLKPVQTHGMAHAPIRHVYRPAPESKFGVLRSVAKLQYRRAQHLPGETSRIPGHEGLARRRRLARIRRQIRVRPYESKDVDGNAERFGENLRDHRVCALPDVDRALMKHDRAIGEYPGLDCRRIRQRGVSASVPASRDTCASPERASTQFRAPVERLGFASRRLPVPAQRVQAFADPHAFPKSLSAYGRNAVVQGVDHPEFERIDPHRSREIVEERFLRNRRLWNTEPPEGA